MSEYIKFKSKIFEIKEKGKYKSLIITALKDLIKTALEEGFNKQCNLIRNNVEYIKKIKEAKNPEGDRFKDKEAFACKMIAVYSLYYDALKEGPPVYCKIPADEAENILAELLHEEEERKGEIDWLDADYDIKTLIDWMDLFTIDQIRIIEDMLKNGMIVDSQEEEIIRHTIKSHTPTLPKEEEIQEIQESELTVAKEESTTEEEEQKREDWFTEGRGKGLELFV
ncbi:hypothetical protein C1646_772671 [Rhizophagus diaphanus]|nr:hypothetical protein C1646_772671 [Rhizophagus diaphanus] [Rhizophagus sp. MUCL 43196]